MGASGSHVKPAFRPDPLTALAKRHNRVGEMTEADARVDSLLEAAYQDMAAGHERESEALEWSEATISDIPADD